MLRKTMQQKRPSVVKTKNEAYLQKTLTQGAKPKSRPKNMNSKIKVVVRKRPVNENEKKKKDCDIITVKDSCTLYIDEPRYKVDMTKYNERHEFIVDKVFSEHVDNYTVYVHTIKPLLVDVFENNCVCSCFAYGQTGSGKTYTMLGAQPYGQSNTPGIFQYAANDIFEFLKMYDTDNSKGIFISFYEIYCGKLYDLLQKRKMVAALENGKKEVVVKDLKVLRVNSKEDLVSKMVEGVLLRKIGVNSQNDESSRSHAILNIDLKDVNKNTSLGKIAFIDLAGSERGADTVAQNKQTQTDGANINRSLLALKECIRAMDAEKNHIPFRDSELTKVLRDIFVGKSKSIMIANVSPTISCCEQTLNTLRYSSRVKNFKNKVNVNEDEEIIEEKPFNIEPKNIELDQGNSMFNYNKSTNSVPASPEVGANSTNNNLEQVKVNIKIGDMKLKNINIKSRAPEKGRDSVSCGKINASIEANNKIKRKKKNSVGHDDKNTYNYEYGVKKHNITQQNYTFTDTSDFSSIDEMNYYLNNNDQNIYMNNRNTRTSNRVKNRNSCESKTPTKERRNVNLTMRNNVGNNFHNCNSFEEEKEREQYEKFKESSNELTNNSSLRETMNLMHSNEDFKNYLNNTINRNINNINNDNKSTHMSNMGSMDNYSNSYKLGSVLGGLNDNPSNMNTMHTINDNDNGNDGISSPYGTGFINYDYNQMDKNTLLNFRKNSDKINNISKGNEEGNVINAYDMNNGTSGINSTNSKCTVNNMYNANSTKINSYSGNTNNSSINMLNENGGKNCNYTNWKVEENYSCVLGTLSSNATLEMVNAESVKKKNNNNGSSYKGISMNAVLKNCLDSQNITNYLSDETKNILNTILLSKHTADKESVLKNYINGDITHMSLEELESCCQNILEKRQILLNNLLAVFKKNVDTQTNNETSDLKKDLLMCHICSDSPDDKFHYYVYSRIEKDLTNLMGLRQIWCESENLRLLHQYLTNEYQNKIALSSYQSGNEANMSLSRSYIGKLKSEDELNAKKGLA